MVETFHHLEDISFGETARKSSSVPLGLEGKWCDHHRRDLSSVFMTVGSADTPWHPQFFSPVTFERFTEQGSGQGPRTLVLAASLSPDGNILSVGDKRFR